MLGDGQYDPTGGDGYLRGDWRKAENALLAGLITDDEYETLAHILPSTSRQSGEERPR